MNCVALKMKELMCFTSGAARGREGVLPGGRSHQRRCSHCRESHTRVETLSRVMRWRCLVCPQLSPPALLPESCMRGLDRGGAGPPLGVCRASLQAYSPQKPSGPRCLPWGLPLHRTLNTESACDDASLQCSGPRNNQMRPTALPWGGDCCL